MGRAKATQNLPTTYYRVNTTMRSFDRGMMVGVGLVVALLIVNVAVTFRNTRNLKEDADWVDHSDQVLDQTSNVMLLLVDMETAERGFVITGDEEFLQPYQFANGRLNATFATLKDLTKDNDPLQPTIQKLEQLKDARVALVEKTIDLRRKSAADAQAFVATKNGKLGMDAIRDVIATMVRDEHDLREDAEKKSRATYVWSIVSEVTAGLLALLLFGAFIWYLDRGMAARQRDAILIRDQREWFRTTLASIGDGVIATDIKGNVTFLNAVAQSLTGWSEHDAQGRPLDAMFKIVNERTRRHDRKSRGKSAPRRRHRRAGQSHRADFEVGNGMPDRR